MKTILLPAFIILSVVTADQLTKLWAVTNLAGQPSYPILGEFLMLTLVYNRGGAMGTNVGSPAVYLTLALAVLPILLVYLYLNRTRGTISLPLAFIAGGAIGNIVDRLRIGRVIDFIDVDFIDINLFGYQLERWWTFNIADACISCAIVFLLFHLSISGQRRHSANPSLPTSN